MKAKEYLKQIEKYETCLQQKVRELEYINMKLTNLTSLRVGEGRGSKSTESKFAYNIIKKVDLENKIHDDINELTDMRDKIIDQIQRMPNTLYMKLLYKRYIEYKKFDRIAREMYFHPGYVRTLHIQALKEFERINLNNF